MVTDLKYVIKKMTSENLITVAEGTSLKQAEVILQENMEAEQNVLCLHITEQLSGTTELIKEQKLIANGAIQKLEQN